MKTIIYQGQEIEVEQVNGASGHMRVATFADYWLDHFGDEELFRDTAGQYYLRRKLNLLDVDGDNHRPASGRTFLHRISLKTATLWAIMRANPESTGLRSDARAALEAPTSTSNVRQFVDGSMSVTLHLPPDPARLFRAACGVDDIDPVCFVYQALSEFAVSALNGGMAERENACNAVFEKHWPEPATLSNRDQYLLRLVDRNGATVEEGPIDNDLTAEVRGFCRDWHSDFSHVVTRLLERGRDMTKNRDYIVELDQRAVSLLEPYTRPKGTTDRVTDTWRVNTWDVVNAAVDFLLSNPEKDGPTTKNEAINNARNRRMGIGEPDDDEGETEQTGFPVRLLWSKDGSEFSDVELDRETLEAIEAHASKWGLGFGEALTDWLREALAASSAVSTGASKQKPLPVYLDPKASALVGRFQKASPRIYSTDDIISGCVDYALTQALDEHARERNHPNNVGRRFADCAWGFVEKDIANVRQRREGKRRFKGDEPEEGYKLVTSRRHVANPADEALLAAPKPAEDEDGNAGAEQQGGR